MAPKVSTVRPRCTHTVRVRAAVSPSRAKAAIVARALEGPVSASCPASVLQVHPRATVLLDPASAALLEHRGAEGRDAVWGHPDLVPTSSDLDDPEAFARNDNSGPDFDISDLDKL